MSTQWVMFGIKNCDTIKKARRFLTDAGVNYHFHDYRADGLSDALLQKYVADSAALWRDHCGSLEQTLLCSVIGTHTGPGVVAVAFFKNGV